jgi:hypothetical protein
MYRQGMSLGVEKTPKLWNETWRIVLLCVIGLFFDYLRGRQGTICERFNTPLLCVDFLCVNLRCGIHDFSFGELKKYNVHPNLGRTLMRPWCHPI